MKHHIFILFILITPILSFNYSLPSLLFSNISGIETDNPSLVVKTQNGLLEGNLLPASNNKSVIAFLGIPYAKAPIGDLRFQPPKKLSNWDGIKKADVQPAICMQRTNSRTFEGKNFSREFEIIL